RPLLGKESERHAHCSAPGWRLAGVWGASFLRLVNRLSPRRVENGHVLWRAWPKALPSRPPGLSGLGCQCLLSYRLPLLVSHSHHHSNQNMGLQSHYTRIASTSSN
ncbi:unnamed protein product, partial [Gulo gulo]